ncbi:MAG: PAS domain S-box protein [Desulfuromonadales bacterium]|nr:PAS domain S-box protein [Desulfuromonadales bacterium]
MTYNSKEKISGPSSAGFFGRLLLLIFAMELGVEVLFSGLFTRLGPAFDCIADGVLVILFSAPFVWFMVVKPLAECRTATGEAIRGASSAMFIKVMLVISLVEFLVNLIILRFLPQADTVNSWLAVACLTTILSAPLLWNVMSLEQRSQVDSLKDLLGTPLKLYVILLGTVFFVDLVELPFVTLFSQHGSLLIHKVIDALLTTLIVAPIFWWLVIRPLRSDARSERSRSDAILAQVVEAIVTIDEQGVILNSNPAAERIFGYAAAEFTGKPLTLLLREEGRSLFDLERSITVIEEGGDADTTQEVSIRRRDGSIVSLEILLNKVIIKEERRYLIFMRDITERKETEAALRESELRFRQIFEQSEDAIIFFKPGSCSIIDLNQTVEKIYGYTKTELKALGMQCLCRQDDFPRFSSVICGVKEGMTSHVDRLANQRKDRSEIIVSMHAKQIALQGVKIVLCSIRDVTERVRLEEEARDMQSKLIQANKMTSLGLLVSGVAHEINNPNNYIMTNSSILDRVWQDALKILQAYYRENGDFQLGGVPFSVMNEDASHLFTGIVDGSRRINELVGNLKDFARQDRSPAMSEVDINRIVTTAVTMLHYQIVKHTERFHLELEENLPMARGNGQQFEQVVINLLINACQSISNKQCGIWVTTGYDENSDQVSVVVRDEGVGMPVAMHSRIMEPFFTTKFDTGGTGLGLSISQSIIRDHNGSLEFTSEPGKGTSFIVKIPAGRSATEEHSS